LVTYLFKKKKSGKMHFLVTYLKKNLKMHF
jgi:hypothetical protein